MLLPNICNTSKYQLMNICTSNSQSHEPWPFIPFISFIHTALITISQVLNQCLTLTIDVILYLFATARCGLILSYRKKFFFVSILLSNQNAVGPYTDPTKNQYCYTIFCLITKTEHILSLRLDIYCRLDFVLNRCTFKILYF